ncbi:MAG: hypothetical protein H7Y37_07935 [Anaerolineae bacterium]|nr:hypothetical protein [Gloeobacterales cyanobacterium ES-bin-313]
MKWQAKATELLQTNKAQTHHIESFQKQIQQQKERIDELTTQSTQLQKELGELKQAKATAATPPGAAVGGGGNGVNEGIQAAVLSLAAAAVNLAQTIAGNQVGVGVSALPISPPQSTAAPITPTRRNKKRNPSTAIGASTTNDSDSGDAVEEGTTTTIPENPPSSGKGSAIARIHRAVQSLMAFNDQQAKREDKWAINQSSLSRLTGANRPALQKYLADHGQEIQAHNHSHGLTDFHNIAKGRAGQDIKTQTALEKETAGN